jgi:hypothetical protein
MGKVLDLQGLPDQVSVMAAKMMEGGGCISVISYAGVDQQQRPVPSTPAPGAPPVDTVTSWCISVISVFRGEK